MVGEDEIGKKGGKGKEKPLTSYHLQNLVSCFL